MRKDPKEGKLLHIMSSGLKAGATWSRAETLQLCRECCGGQGFLSENKIGNLKNDTDIDGEQGPAQQQFLTTCYFICFSIDVERCLIVDLLTGCLHLAVTFEGDNTGEPVRIAAVHCLAYLLLVMNYCLLALASVCK